MFSLDFPTLLDVQYTHINILSVARIYRGDHLGRGP